VFTGIVEGVGTVVAAVHDGASVRLEVEAARELLEGVVPGDSVSVAGACLTVVRREAARVDFDVVAETVRRTALGTRTAGDGVNLERALRLGDRLGGHIVLGHVDAVAHAALRRAEGDSVWLELSAPPDLARFLPDKAFVTLDGVSLTVARGADPDGRFAVALIPETLRRTTLGRLAPGDAVNLEVDPLARYVDSLLAAREMPRMALSAAEGVIR